MFLCGYLQLSNVHSGKQVKQNWTLQEILLKYIVIPLGITSKKEEDLLNTLRSIETLKN